MSDVFLSYSSKDRDLARRVVNLKGSEINQRQR